ncbi:sulfite exporter TauE/SafE family protein [Sneathiella aquimaris]|uniref:sulfite exporter TauE/SafE family protein n=1 Tax=Sneathiella aquimaris TaxID=2599305 RepID=UPI00146E69B7|nr:sulfite exporter TauE/SafE family protein [Sneathiella aquimaris]
MFETSLLILSAFLAGGLNSIAGGGSFLTFPALVYVGLPSVSANATSAVVVFPAYLSGTFGFMKELKNFGLKPLLTLVFISIAGGVLGATLLLITPNEIFRTIVPYLLIFATALFAFGDKITALLPRNRVLTPFKSNAISLIVTTYGGYFNGGLGIVLLSLFSVLGFKDINLMNGLKNLLSFILSIASIVTFTIAGIINWDWALIMMISATVGGYVGALLARKLSKEMVRRIIVVVGILMAIAFFVTS